MGRATLARPALVRVGRVADVTIPITVAAPPPFIGTALDAAGVVVGVAGGRATDRNVAVATQGRAPAGRFRRGPRCATSSQRAPDPKASRPVTPQKLAAVRRTWSLAAAIPVRTSQVFYGTLFRIDPSTKPLFVGDIEMQGRKLALTLGFIVDHLDDLDSLQPAARDLAIRHVAYGVTAAQYDSVGRALILTLKQILGPDFGPAEEAAWVEVYGTLARDMTATAYGEAYPLV